MLFQLRLSKHLQGNVEIIMDGIMDLEGSVDVLM
jgi:hypothetical protein